MSLATLKALILNSDLVYRTRSSAVAEPGPQRSLNGSRVLLYSGQFDPFHETHKTELAAALGMCGWDRALVVPVPASPGGDPTERAPPWLRIRLCETAVEDFDGVEVDSVALRDDLRTAPELVRRVRAERGSDARIVLLMGADNFRALASWDEAEALLSQTDLLVSTRPGFEIDDPLECLPESIRDRYAEVRPGRWVNLDTGRFVAMKDLGTDGLSSWDVVVALREGDQETLKRALSGPSQDLFLQHYYPDVDWERRDRLFELGKGMRARAKAVLGPDVARRLDRSKGFCARLSAIDPEDPEATAAITDLVYQTVREQPDLLPRVPDLYRRAVRFALDEDLRAMLRKCGDPKPPRAGAGANLLASFAGLSTWLRERVKPVVQDLSQQRTEALASGRPAENLEPLRRGGIGTIRVYIGLSAGADIDKITDEGLTSKLERAFGADEANAELETRGERALLIQHQLGDYSRTPFVSTSLSPAVAGGFYAGAAGHVVVADVPVSEAYFVNDPELWRDTPFESTGNPFWFNQEICARRVRPEWIAEILPAETFPADRAAGLTLESFKGHLRVIQAALKGR